MLKTMLLLSGPSALLYLLFAFKGWLGQLGRRQQSLAAPRKAYFWGLVFAALFYYALPLWWWRYGFGKSVTLILICLGLAAASQATLFATGAVGPDSFGGPIGVSFFVSIPIRVIIGLWVAKHDASWRSKILLQRIKRSQSAKK